MRGFSVVAALAAVAAAAGIEPAARVVAQAPVPTISVTSPTMKTGETMPRDYTPDGKNLSPPLQWSGAPAGTRSFAVFCEDHAVGNPPPFVHWVIYNIPGTATGLPEGIPIDPAAPMPAEIAGATQGITGFGRARAIYRGPAPPPGTPHHYRFVVYALNADEKLPPMLNRAQVLERIKGAIIGEGEIVPIYERKGVPGQAPGGRGRGRGAN
jgi:Raf kinase inhibitor-like YbhB/YbcL family protein